MAPGRRLLHASLRRLSPDPLTPAPSPIVGKTTKAGSTAAYAVFPSPSGTAWAPATYAVDATWMDATGKHRASWHLELKPGRLSAPSRLLDAARGFARFAGSKTLVIGVDTLLPVAFGGTSCDDPHAANEPTVLGISHPVGMHVTDVQARLASSGGRTIDVPLRIVSDAVAGMTLAAPASGGTFPAGLYRLTIGETNGLPRVAVCLGAGPFAG
jgi:hypothetical protein